MPLGFLLDENLRGPLWNAIQRHNARTDVLPVDLLCVGEPGAPPLGTKDPALLEWLQQHDRVLITRDKSSMRAHLEQHLASGGHSPGILTIGRLTIPEVVDHIALAAVACDAEELRDQIVFVD
jgi:hypothetical protein